LELRSVSGASNKDYGILVSKTPLAIMTRQDRYDALWLAENWTNVQSYMKEMDISSGSAAYLRQKMTKKTSDEPKAPSATETDAKPSAGVQSSEKPAIDEASSIPTEGSDSAEVSVDNEEDFALSMAQIVEQSGLDLKKVIDALLKLA
jgi:hypothetical protein